jgi:RimJ/RimL family protein N-acetyltransferase
VLASLEWARERFGGQRATCIIAPDNTASLKVAGKCGFREFARTDYKGSTVVMFERTL